jgi:hypothetical protein
MRQVSTCLTVSFAIGMLSLVWGGEADVPRMADDETAFEQAVGAAMEQPISAAFDDVLLADMIEHVEQMTGIQFRFDHKALTQAGIGPAETTVSLNVDNVRVRTALRLVFDQLDLTWVIAGEVVMITSKHEAENMLSVRVYNVDDLVVRPDGSANFQLLIELLTSTIDAHSWDETGGPGTIKEYRNGRVHSLVVSQSQQVHEQIGGVLASLRQSRRQQTGERTARTSSTSSASTRPPKTKAPRQRRRAYATSPGWTNPLTHD